MASAPLPVLLTALALAVGCSSSPTPTADAGTPDAPRTDAPSTDAPSTDAPSTDAPDGGSLDVPATDVPTADVPTADVPTADVPTADVPTADVPPNAPPAEPRLVVLSHEGRIASVGLAAPYAVRASADLRAMVGSARCRFGLCVVTHPEPANALSVVSAADLTVRATIALGDRVDPRDVAIVDDHTAVVSLYERAELLQVDLVTRATTPIDLRALADADGLPEATWLATCGRRVFAQLRRVEHESGADSPMNAVLAVVDLARPAGDRLVDADPAAPGVQGVALARRPAFDMPADCAAGTLHVAEPMPLMRGGGGYEVVNLATLSATAPRRT
ncbi:MAG: hypothetical protein IPN17_35105 [Deltaproteobacteria bacterium]|nr:hypothetical protein [Deltaproteobacteria bacterium]